MVLICVWLVAKDFPYKRLITVALFLSCIDSLGLPPLFIALILMFYRGIGLQIYLQRERSLLKAKKDNISAMLAALENSHKEETAQLSATIDSLKTIINDNTVMLARVLEHLKGVEDDGEKQQERLHPVPY